MLKGSKEISQAKWRFQVWGLIIFGTLVWIIFNGLVTITLQAQLESPSMMIRYLWFSNMGSLIIGLGFGLAYARVWKIKGVDY